VQTERHKQKKKKKKKKRRRKMLSALPSLLGLMAAFLKAFCTAILSVDVFGTALLSGNPRKFTFE